MTEVAHRLADWAVHAGWDDQMIEYLFGDLETLDLDEHVWADAKQLRITNGKRRGFRSLDRTPPALRRSHQIAAREQFAKTLVARLGMPAELAYGAVGLLPPEDAPEPEWPCPPACGDSGGGFKEAVAELEARWAEKFAAHAKETDEQFAELRRRLAAAEQGGGGTTSPYEPLEPGQVDLGDGLRVWVDYVGKDWRRPRIRTNLDKAATKKPRNLALIHEVGEPGSKDRWDKVRKVQLGGGRYWNGTSYRTLNRDSEKMTAVLAVNDLDTGKTLWKLELTPDDRRAFKTG